METNTISDKNSHLLKNSTADLIQHLLGSYHSKMKTDFEDILPLFEKVARVHGDKHPELIQAFHYFQHLANHLSVHLKKEEDILFPMFIDFENGKSDFPKAVFQGPMSVMLSEHDSDSNLMAEIEKMTNHFVLPEGACRSYQALFAKLQQFDVELKSHMEIEEQILFPRFASADKGACGGHCSCGG